MSDQEKNQKLRDAIFSAVETAVGLPLDRKPVSLSQPIPPPITHFRRTIKHPSLMSAPQSTNVTELANPLVEERSPPSTPVRQIAQPLAVPPAVPKKPSISTLPSFRKKPSVLPPSPSPVMTEPEPEPEPVKKQEVSEPMEQVTKAPLQPMSTPIKKKNKKQAPVPPPPPPQEDTEEDMYADSDKEEESPKKTAKKKRTFEIEIDPSELSGVGSSFPVNKVSTAFFKGFFDNGQLKEDDAPAEEEDEGEMMESAMISEIGSAIVSPDSSDDEIDFEDKGVIQDDDDVEEVKVVTNETNQVKRKKEEPQQARKVVKSEKTFNMPSEQDTATALLLETERCMVPDIAQINTILANTSETVLNIQHRRLVNVWMSLFASDWYGLDSDNRNIFHRLLKPLVSGWILKSNTMPSYGRINNLVFMMQQAPCCVMDIQANLKLSPSVSCYVSDIKATETNIGDFIRVHMTMQTKSGDICNEIAFYCLNKYKNLISALYFSLHNASWVYVMGSSDATVQENVEKNKGKFHKKCIDTLQTLHVYQTQL